MARMLRALSWRRATATYAFEVKAPARSVEARAWRRDVADDLDAACGDHSIRTHFLAGGWR